MKKVVIADHHPIVRKGISCILKNDVNLSIVGIVDNGSDLYKNLEEHKPDILIMEIDMPHTNGFYELRNIKEKFPETSVLIFSVHPEEIYALRSIKLGAAGYLPKTATYKTFLEAIKLIREGGIFINEELNSAFTNRNIGEINAMSRYKKLSSREIEVLNMPLKW